MSKNLETLLNLPETGVSDDDLSNLKASLSGIGTEIKETAENNDKGIESFEESTQKALSIINDRESRVNAIVDLKEYDADVDTLFVETLDAFKEIMIAAKDVQAPSAGKMFEAAANFAKIALDSKNSKMKTRLDAIDLALKKQRLEQTEKSKDKDDTIDGDSVFLDRNEILKQIEAMSKNNDSKNK